MDRAEAWSRGVLVALAAAVAIITVAIGTALWLLHLMQAAPGGPGDAASRIVAIPTPRLQSAPQAPGGEEGRAP
jgi:hypothetical protein